MIDDTYFITPHETALATVATSMKKARLRLHTLIINSIVGGILFSSGSFLYMSVHVDNPDTWSKNPGFLNLLGGLTFGIGLFYVVITGADLFNSNILFFSVGLFRGAVTIYDLLISWFVSWLGNIAGCLFVSYVFVHLSKTSGSKLWVEGSRKLAEDKASFTFMETFLKGIAGNFYVCLAVYLQLMAKPIHVKFLCILLPIFTFVSIGFSHVVADMGILYVGMLNGAHVSVGKYIWKLLIPCSLGNMIGGAAFSLVIPFYLHLITVENDRKQLALPEYEARDEQPELNVDSRVVRISPQEHREFEDDDDDSSSDSNTVTEDKPIEKPHSSDIDAGLLRNRLSRGGTQQSSDSDLSNSIYTQNSEYEEAPKPFNPPSITLTDADNQLLRRTSTRTTRRGYVRSPPGVFPVRGMGDPLTRERTIENATYKGVANQANTEKNTDLSKSRTISLGDHFHKNDHNALERIKTLEKEEENEYETEGGYNVLETKPGAKLEKVVTRLIDRSRSNVSKSNLDLPRTTQDAFPHNDPNSSKSYEKKSTPSLSNLIRKVSRQFEPSFEGNTENIDERLNELGIDRAAANMANNIAGVENFTNINPPRAKTYEKVSRVRNSDSPKKKSNNSKMTMTTSDHSHRSRNSINQMAYNNNSDVTASSISSSMGTTSIASYES